jgi:hypothetical protein
MNFWDVHGILFIAFMLFFPRLTMLLTGICLMPFAGILFWIGWVLVPRLTVAVLATTFYWHTNTILVILTWFWALGGESTEKGACKRAYSRTQELSP